MVITLAGEASGRGSTPAPCFLIISFFRLRKKIQVPGAIPAIDHFTVVDLVTWPLNGSEAGVDLVLIQTSLLLLCKSSCSYAN